METVITYRNRNWYAADLTQYAIEVLHTAVVVLWSSTLDGSNDAEIVDRIVRAEQFIEQAPDDLAVARQAIEEFEPVALDDEDCSGPLLTMMSLSSTPAVAAAVA